MTESSFSRNFFLCSYVLLFIPNLIERVGGKYLDIYPSDLSMNESFPLYFGLMLSLSGDHQSTGALAGVQAALDDINSRDDLLPGYSLHYTLTDSKVICRQLSPGVSFVM